MLAPSVLEAPPAWRASEGVSSDAGSAAAVSSVGVSSTAAGVSSEVTSLVPTSSVEGVESVSESSAPPAAPINHSIINKHVIIKFYTELMVKTHHQSCPFEYKKKRLPSTLLHQNQQTGLLSLSSSILQRSRG